MSDRRKNTLVAGHSVFGANENDGHVIDSHMQQRHQATNIQHMAMSSKDAPMDFNYGEDFLQIQNRNKSDIQTHKDIDNRYTRDGNATASIHHSCINIQHKEQSMQ